MDVHELSVEIGRKAIHICSVVVLACTVAFGQSQPASRADLVVALQHGGHVIVMRHASSPRAVPDRLTASPDNTMLERELDQAGRAGAIALGKALRDLNIPVVAVLSSPTYRARETVRLAQLPPPKIYDELGDGGQSMQGVSATQGEWLRKRVTQFPKRGNTVIVTHLPNISAAFPEYSQGLSDGEALVFGSAGKGGARLMARIRIEEWRTLGSSSRMDSP